MPESEAERRARLRAEHDRNHDGTLDDSEMDEALEAEIAVQDAEDTVTLMEMVIEGEEEARAEEEAIVASEARVSAEEEAKDPSLMSAHAQGIAAVGAFGAGKVGYGAMKRSGKIAKGVVKTGGKWLIVKPFTWIMSGIDNVVKKALKPIDVFNLIERTEKTGVDWGKETEKQKKEREKAEKDAEQAWKDTWEGKVKKKEKKKKAD